MSKKLAVVTGANKGIGLAIVKGLCKAGFKGDILLTALNEKLGQEVFSFLCVCVCVCVLHSTVPLFSIFCM